MKGIDMEWQPIETAPKDGEMVLLFDPNYQMAIIGWFGEDPNGGDEAEWLHGDGDDWSCGYYYTPCNPTHWMPLPKPPVL